jgi:hypothetical protein
VGHLSGHGISISTLYLPHLHTKQIKTDFKRHCRPLFSERKSKKGEKSTPQTTTTFITGGAWIVQISYGFAMNAVVTEVWH